MFRGSSPSVPSLGFLAAEDATDKLSEAPSDFTTTRCVTQRMQISLTSRRKPAIAHLKAVLGLLQNRAKCAVIFTADCMFF